VDKNADNIYYLKAKISPPNFRVPLVREKALKSLRYASLDSPVTFVEAPPGYGKTMLMTHWFREGSANDSLAIWLFLDEEDTCESIINYLEFALLQHGKTGNSPIDTAAAGLDDGYVKHQLMVFLSKLEEIESQVSIYLDDIERLQDPSTFSFLDFLIERLPSNVRIICAGRQNPGLDLARVDVAGSLFHVSVEQLRFSKNEYGEFFGQKLSDQSIQEIDQKIEGWGAGLQMLKSSAQKAGGADLANVISDFSDQTTLAHQYIEKHIYSNLPKNIQGILCSLSVLEWFDDDIAFELTTEHIDVRRLSTDPFLTGFIFNNSEGQNTFRMHALLRDFCLKNLRENSAQEFERGNKRAAAIMARNGHLVKALKHAMACGDEQQFAEIFESFGGLRIWLREGMLRLNEAVSLFKDNVELRYPRLGLAKCIVLIKQAKINEASKLLVKLTRETDGFLTGPSSDETGAAQIDHDFVQIMMMVYGCHNLDLDLINSLLPQSISQDEEDAILGHNKNLLLVANSQKANFEAARALVQQTIDHLRSASSLYGPLYVDFHVGAIEMATGNSELAHKNYERARKLARKKFPSDQGLKLVGDVLSFELAVERCQRHGLNSRLNNIVRSLHSAEAWLDIYIAAYVSVSDYFRQLNATDRMEDFLEDGLIFADETGLRRLRDAIRLVKTQQYLAGNRLEEAEREYAAIIYEPKQQEWTLKSHSWRELELRMWVEANLFYQRSDYEKATRTAQAIADFGVEKNIARMSVKGYALIAAIFSKQDRMGGALRALEALLPYAAKNGYLRPVQWFSSEIQTTIDGVDNERITTRLSPIIGALDLDNSQSDNPNFSIHEINVIHQLKNGLQDKQIARKLGVTEHAVRYHLKKIYQKTHARNRTEAIRNINEFGGLL